jgi:hypothetical protein
MHWINLLATHDKAAMRNACKRFLWHSRLHKRQIDTPWTA